MVRESIAAAQEAGAEVELVTLAGKTISLCDACYSCRRIGGKCHLKDDMQDIYTKLLEADGIIFGTPVYFWTVCAQAKVLIDRTYAFLEERKLRGKVAGVVVAEERMGGTSAFTVFNNFFHIHRMIMVGGAIGFDGRGKGSIKNDKRGMTEAKALGKAIVRRIQAR